MSKLGRSLKRNLTWTLRTLKEKQTGKIEWKYRFQELWRNVKDVIWYKWTNEIIVFWESCKRTIKWFPIIWKDRHWDYNFLFVIMKHKLKFMRETIDKYGNAVWVSKQRKLKQMRTCELLLDRIIENDYCKFERDELNKKWGTLKIGRKGIYRPKALTEKEKEQESKDFRNIYEKQDYLYKQDIEILFSMLKKYHKDWWD